MLYQRTQPCCEPPQVISAHVRELLGITEAPWSRSIADPPRDVRGRFLEEKSRTGEPADSLTYQQFLDDVRQWAQRESQRWRSAAETRTCQRRFISPPVSSWWLRWHTRSGSHARVDINTSHQRMIVCHCGWWKIRYTVRSKVMSGSAAPPPLENYYFCFCIKHCCFLFFTFSYFIGCNDREYV